MTGGHDAYAGFAAHYDLQGWDWYAGMFGERLRQLLAERGLEGSRLLDAGCGTGTLALSLAGAGYRVTGVDLSERMLEVARRKDAEGIVDWRCQDITRLELDGPFDAVVSVADILNHLESPDEWRAALEGFGAHLRSGGYLFLDAMTCLGLERLDGFTVKERPGASLVVGAIYEPRARRSTLRISSFLEQPDSGLYERASETITEWGRPVADVLRLLDNAGFEDIERPWAQSEDPEAEERLTLLARRR